MAARSTPGTSASSGQFAESAATGLGEAQVIEAKAVASQKQGTAEAKVIEMKALAEAKGITEKADAMKNFDGEGRELSNKLIQDLEGTIFVICPKDPSVQFEQTMKIKR